jgi:hypothetical protein
MEFSEYLEARNKRLKEFSYIQYLPRILRKNSKIKNELNKIINENGEIKSKDEICFLLKNSGVRNKLYSMLIDIDIDERPYETNRGIRINRFLNKTLPKIMEEYINLREDNLYVTHDNENN